MKLLGLLILMSSARLAFGQVDMLNITITEIADGAESEEYLEECNEARQQAIQDIQAGNLKIEYYIGLTSEKRDHEFEEFYTNYLISKYKIDRELTGCTSGPGRICYFEEMDKAITEKYGLSTDSLRSTAKKEYQRFKILDNNGRKKYIAFNHAYWRVDERASYINGTKDLQLKLKERIDFNKFNLKDYKLKGFHTEVTIDELGNVVSCKVVSKNFPEDANEAVQKAVKEIGGWKPVIRIKSEV